MTDLEQAIENVITNLCQRTLDLPSAHTNPKYNTHEHTIATYTQAINTLCEAKAHLATGQSRSSCDETKLDRDKLAKERADRCAEENFRRLANL